MAKKKEFLSLFYIASIVFLPWWISPHLHLIKTWNLGLIIGGILSSPNFF